MGEYEDTRHDSLPSRTTQDELTPAERKAESLILSAVGVVLSEVPILGTAYTELRSYRWQQFIESRLSTMNRELMRRMEGVSEEAVNKDYLNSEAFYDFIGKAVETVMRSRDREKVAFIASILKGTVLNP